jgi:hypothetical protein
MTVGRIQCQVLGERKPAHKGPDRVKSSGAKSHISDIPSASAQLTFTRRLETTQGRFSIQFGQMTIFLCSAELDEVVGVNRRDEMTPYTQT